MSELKSMTKRNYLNEEMKEVPTKQIKTTVQWHGTMAELLEMDTIKIAPEGLKLENELDNVIISSSVAEVTNNSPLSIRFSHETEKKKYVLNSIGGKIDPTLKNAETFEYHLIVGKGQTKPLILEHATEEPLNASSLKILSATKQELKRAVEIVADDNNLVRVKVGSLLFDVIAHEQNSQRVESLGINIGQVAVDNKTEWTTGLPRDGIETMITEILNMKEELTKEYPARDLTKYSFEISPLANSKFSDLSGKIRNLDEYCEIIVGLEFNYFNPKEIATTQ